MFRQNELLKLDLLQWLSPFEVVRFGITCRTARDHACPGGLVHCPTLFIDFTKPSRVGFHRPRARQPLGNRKPCAVNAKAALGFVDHEKVKQYTVVMHGISEKIGVFWVMLPLAHKLRHFALHSVHLRGPGIC